MQNLCVEIWSCSQNVQTNVTGEAWKHDQLCHETQDRVKTASIDYIVPGTGKGFELAATLLGEFRQNGTLFEMNLS